jgi:hypothetical protein
MSVMDLEYVLRSYCLVHVTTTDHCLVQVMDLEYVLRSWSSIVNE